MPKNEEIIAHVLTAVTARLQQLATALDNEARYESSVASKLDESSEVFDRGYYAGIAHGCSASAAEVRRVIEELQTANG